MYKTEPCRQLLSQRCISHYALFGRQHRVSANDVGRISEVPIDVGTVLYVDA